MVIQKSLFENSLLTLAYNKTSSAAAPSGNSNLVYTIIRKRHVFHALANLPSDLHGISKCLSNRKIASVASQSIPARPSREYSAVSPSAASSVRQTVQADHSDGDRDNNGHNDDDVPLSPQPKLSDDIETHSDTTKSDIEESMEGSHPALPAEPGTLKASLLETPAIATMTERESAHPIQQPMDEFSPMTENCNTNKVQEVDNGELAKLTLKENDVDDAKVAPLKRTVNQRGSIRVSTSAASDALPVWAPTPDWVASWRAKLPLQTIMRLLQVLVPQVEKICIDK